MNRNQIIQNPQISKYSLYFLIIIYTVGALGFIFQYQYDLLLSLTPLNLSLSLGFLLFFHHSFNKNFILWASFIFLAGWLLEWVGVKTGFPFGEYEYGKTLGWAIDGIPLMMGVNWLVLIYCNHIIAHKINKNPYFIALFTAVSMTIMDYFLEPVAVKHQFWTWYGADVPISNYAGWFVYAFILALSSHWFKIEIKNPIAIGLLIIQFLFFIVLALF